MTTSAPRAPFRPLAFLLSLLLAVSALTIPALAAHAAPSDVAGATLQWGVKTSFRAYLTGFAGGRWVTSGVSDASPFGWSGGSGSATSGTGSVGYPGSLQFQGHPGVGVGADEYALDLTFSDVAVRVTGATTAELVLDARSRSQSDPTTFDQFADVVFATLDLTAGTDGSTDEVIAYAGVPASLTAVGSAALAGFYPAGTALDPVSFSWPVEAAEPEPVVPTITVSDTTELHSGDVVTVTGTGFGPDETGGPRGTRPPLAGKFSGVYVVFGTFLDTWKPSAGAPSSARKAAPGGTKWVLSADDVATVGGTAAGAVALEPDGSFQLQLTVTEDFTGALANGNYGIYTYPASGAISAPFETFTPLTFAAMETSTTLGISPSGSVVEGIPVTLGATVTAGVPGAVRFTDGTTALGEVAAADGSAELVVTPAVGDHAFRAVFVPTDLADHAASQSSVVPLTVTARIPVAAGSLVWGVKASFRSYVLGDIAHGTITSAGGASSVAGGYHFPQSSGALDASGLGSASYRGSVTFSGHGGALSLRLTDPMVRITSASSAVLSVATSSGRIDLATLDLPRAVRSTEAGGAVTYTGAPAALTSAGAGTFSGFYTAGEALDPVTFTVGSADPLNGAGSTLGTTRVTLRSPASAPPATTGISASGTGFVEGGEYTFTAEGFQPNEFGILVVVYSTPTLLATDARADAAGVVTWTGSLPPGLSGQHTLTFQGSVDRGLVLEIAPAELVGCTVEGAELHWGFKESFRAYIDGSIANGEWTTAGGTGYETPLFTWSNGNGGYDTTTEDADLAFTGSVRFTGHGGLLDTTIAAPRVVIDGDRATLLLDVTGTTQSGEPVAQAGVEFADLDLAAAERAGGGDLVAISGIPATLTAAGAAAFGTYPEGEALDPLDLRITLDPACVAPVVAEDEPRATTTAVSAEAPIWPWLLAAIAAVVLVGCAVLVMRRIRRTV